MKADAASAVAGGAHAMRALMLATMAIWGLNLSVIKLLLATQPPMAVSAVRMGIAAVFLSAALRWGLRRRWPRLSRRQWAWLLACAVLAVYFNQICFIHGMSRTTAANAALIIALNPLLASLFAALTFGERLTGPRIAGIALGFGGVAAVVLDRPGAALGVPGLGDALVLLSVATWVGSGAMVQRIGARVDSATISWVIHSAGAVLLLLHVTVWPAPLNWPALTPVNALLLVLSGLLASGVGALAWNRALVTLGVARTALYAYWVPIFGVLFAVVVLDEPLSVWHAIGLAAVLGGTWFGTRAGWR